MRPSNCLLMHNTNQFVVSELTKSTRARRKHCTLYYRFIKASVEKMQQILLNDICCVLY